MTKSLRGFGADALTAVRPARAVAVACVCLAAVSAAVAHAQVSGPLIAVKKVTCRFTSMATGSWTGARSEAAVHPAALNLSYEAIDTEDGSARAVTGNGTVDIIAKLSGSSLHLLSIGTDGSVYLTTVFDRETVPGRFRAVHTRHEYTDIAVPGFTSRPEQYYGDCTLSK